MKFRITPYLVYSGLSLLMTFWAGGLLAKDLEGDEQRKPLKNWYISLKVEAPELRLVDKNAKLGQLKVANAAAGNSLKALSPFDSDYLYVAFIDPEGVEESGEYKTSFHRRWRDARRADRWDFTVKSSNPESNVILSWSPLYLLQRFRFEGNFRYTEERAIGHPFSKRMKLIDLETGAEVPMVYKKDLQSYSFNMNGSTARNFTWVLQDRKVEIEDYAPVAMQAVADEATATVVSKQLRRVIQTTEQDLYELSQQRGVFDLSKPPQTLQMD